MIEISELTKVYPSGCRAVDKLNLSIEQGEIFALLGPNGAGKTSTVRVLSTLAGFDSGTVIVAGHNVDTEPDKVRSAIGFVGQQAGVDYFLSGRENLLLHGQLYRIPRSELDRRIEELAAYFNFADSLDELVMTYSGGMRRKLDIATALIHKPQVLFLDEPTLGLDINSRQSLWQLIEKLNSELRLTILLTTHYLEEADKLAHRVGIINAGKIQVTGPPEELKSSISGDAVVLVFDQITDAVRAFEQAIKQQPFIINTVWEHDKLHLYLENPASNITSVMQVAAEHAVEIKTLSLSHPSLDDVFLKYTGTSMEGGETEEEEPWWQQWAGKGGGWGGKKWQQWEDQGGDSESSETAAGEWPDQQQWGNQQWDKEKEREDKGWDQQDWGDKGQDWQRDRDDKS